jgi:signal transduction histidine kinase/DNA-binding response OmpR family regulator
VANNVVPVRLVEDTEDILDSLAAALESPPGELSPANRERLEQARAGMLRVLDEVRTGVQPPGLAPAADAPVDLAAQHPGADPIPAAAEDAAVHPATPKGRVLLAVADPEVRAYVSDLLADQFQVDTVADGTAALAHVRAQRPDLLLLGSRVQRSDGFELLRAIAGDSSLADLPVILLSPTASGNARLAGMQAGTTGYLVKPLSAGELVTRAAAAVESRVATREALEAERRMTARLSALASAALAFQRVESVPQLLDLITQTAATLIAAHLSLSFVVSAPDWSHSLRSVWLSDKYAQYRGFNVQETGKGIYAMVCETNLPVRLTQAELEAHPRYRGFSEYAAEHPPLRGWLAVPLVAADGRNLGLMQLSDKREGEFTADDEFVLVHLAHMAASAIETTGLLDRLHKTASQLTVSAVTKDQMLGLVSHELRTPLTTLRGNANILRRYGAHIARADRERALSDIEHDAERLAGIVDNMLALARLDAGVGTDLEPLLLRRIMESAISDFGRYTGRAVDLKVPENLTPVLGKEAYIHQIVINLLTNAVKYGGPSGSIEVELTCDGEQATVSVADRGPGIPPEVATHLFEPFFRAREFESKKPGIGLGLPVCKRLVEAQGGKIWMQPREGGGSVFCFSLPIVNNY